MIKGIGIDLIEVARIKSAMKRAGFLERYFTEQEMELFALSNMNPQRIAGNFSSKEAVVKMLGTGFVEIRLKDIEILRDKMGKPYVHLYHHAKRISDEIGIAHIHLSISNTKEFVTAVAVGE